MVNRRLLNPLCNMIALILSMLLVSFSSLSIISYGENLVDAVIAVFTYFGIRSCCLMCVSLFHWFHGGNNRINLDK